MQELARKYCIDPEIVFEIHRPIIRGIAPPKQAQGHEEQMDAEMQGEQGAVIS
jgi:hypothetical protein